MGEVCCNRGKQVFILYVSKIDTLEIILKDKYLNREFSSIIWLGDNGPISRQSESINSKHIFFVYTFSFKNRAMTQISETLLFFVN